MSAEPYVEIPWSATVSGGAIRMKDKAGYDAWLSQTLGDGEQVMVIVVPMAEDHYHAAAFRYYRNCVLPLIADAMGEPNIEKAHDILATKFLPLVPAKTRRSLLVFKRKSTAMDAMPCAQFCDYIDRLIAWASSPDELNLRIPMADRRWKVTRS